MRMLALAGALLVVSCNGSPTSPDDLPLLPLLSEVDVVGEYRLTHIASTADLSEAPLPAWTWPGRVLVLEGTLTLRPDGRYVITGRSRLTMFGDTTYVSGADSASWTMGPGNTIQFLTGLQSPENQGRASRGVVVVYAGGFGSGGTVFRYQRLPR